MTHDSGYVWLERSPSNRASACDQCHKWVAADLPRMRVHDKKGPDRKRGRKSRSSYVCISCAYVMFGVRPPPKQEGLF